MSVLTIHLGLHKTGTTFLQSQLFPRLTQIELIKAWLSPEFISSQFSKKKLLISDEGISGRLWNGTYLRDFNENVEKIKKLYGDPNIIIGIRKHEDFILSIYKQYLHEKGTKGIDFIFNPGDTGIIKTEEILFNPRIEKLQNAFSNVFVYTQESLENRQQDFINGLMRFLQIDGISPPNEDNFVKLNVGVWTEFQVKLLINLNRINKILEDIYLGFSLYSSIFRKLDLTPRHICQWKLKNVSSKKYKLEEDLRHFISDYYESDWNEASKKISY